jgi:hypothetical protein
VNTPAPTNTDNNNSGNTGVPTADPAAAKKIKANLNMSMLIPPGMTEGTLMADDKFKDAVAAGLAAALSGNGVFIDPANIKITGVQIANRRLVEVEIKDGVLKERRMLKRGRLVEVEIKDGVLKERRALKRGKVLKEGKVLKRGKILSVTKTERRDEDRRNEDNPDNPITAQADTMPAGSDTNPEVMPMDQQSASPARKLGIKPISIQYEVILPANSAAAANVDQIIAKVLSDNDSSASGTSQMTQFESSFEQGMMQALSQSGAIESYSVLIGSTSSNYLGTEALQPGDTDNSGTDATTGDDNPTFTISDVQVGGGNTGGQGGVGGKNLRFRR